MTCTYLVRKNRANKLSPKVFCGKIATAIYRSEVPDAYGLTEHPRCDEHDTKTARDYVARTAGWTREVL